MTPQKRKFLLDAIMFKFQFWSLPDLLLLWTHAGTKLDAHVALCLPPFNDILFFFWGGFEVEGNWQTYNCSCKDIVVKHFWAIKWKIFASKHFPKDPSSTGYLSQLGGVVKHKCRECLRLLFGSGDSWWLAGYCIPSSSESFGKRGWLEYTPKK